MLSPKEHIGQNQNEDQDRQPAPAMTTATPVAANKPSNKPNSSSSSSKPEEQQEQQEQQQHHDADPSLQKDLPKLPLHTSDMPVTPLDGHGASDYTNDWEPSPLSSPDIDSDNRIIPAPSRPPPRPPAPRRTSGGSRNSIITVGKPEIGRAGFVAPPPVKLVTMSTATDSTGDTYETRDTDESLALGPLQAQEKLDHLAPLESNGDDPASYDLVVPPTEGESQDFSLVKRSEQLFSREHLMAMFSEPSILLKYTSFLSNRRPQSIHTLIYYLDALKALKAIAYSNAIADALEPLPGQSYSNSRAAKTANRELEEKAEKTFDLMVQEDLPAFITQVYINVVSESISKRITGTLPPHLREASEGLAEVFCLTDPARADNPIVFASEEFHRTTQYGLHYSIGRNCRFLQGPKTSPHSVRRLREACEKGKEHSEVFLNYRRDGSPFMNLLMMAPLRDSRGTIRYFIGAQVDVSGLVRDCSELPSLQKMLDDEQEKAKAQREEAKAQAKPLAAAAAAAATVSSPADVPSESDPSPSFLLSPHLGAEKDEFQALAEMFNQSELDTVRRHGGRMHSETTEDSGGKAPTGPVPSHRPRLLLQESSDPEIDAAADDGNKGPQHQQQQHHHHHHHHHPRPQPALRAPASNANLAQSSVSGKLQGVYQHYLLVRPYPSLRILFASPSLRMPGMLQSPFVERIGGSERVRAELENALAEGRGVTARIRWLSKFGDGEGRPRWIHATPLLGSNGHIGVWMVVLVDIEGEGLRRKWKPAPPVMRNLSGLRADGGGVLSPDDVRSVRSGKSGFSVDLR